MIISALRYIVFDKILFRKYTCEFDWSKIDIEKYRLLTNIRYRYYQFYSNTVIASLIAIKLLCVYKLFEVKLIVLLFLSAILFTYCEYDCFKRYYSHSINKEEI